MQNRLALPHVNFVGNFYVELTAKVFGGEIVANRRTDGISNSDIRKTMRHHGLKAVV